MVEQLAFVTTEPWDSGGVARARCVGRWGRDGSFWRWRRRGIRILCGMKVLAGFLERDGVSLPISPELGG